MILSALQTLQFSSFLCLSQESSCCASAQRDESFSPGLGWLDSCDKHRNEETFGGVVSHA
ncbi:hypothetical protein DXM21_10135 [Agrobacterium rosae]|nr:hypothetical protein DXM21_10135 [Agrobacterium rosae]KAA3521206.1 hypothetical protein DXM25_07840 [Agrobacterium rosae]MQB48068.1 hypothetical protein [Agrobacterium rosae]